VCPAAFFRDRLVIGIPRSFKSGSLSLARWTTQCANGVMKLEASLRILRIDHAIGGLTF
jgi:hypothetical protein